MDIARCNSCRLANYSKRFFGSDSVRLRCETKTTFKIFLAVCAPHSPPQVFLINWPVLYVTRGRESGKLGARQWRTLRRPIERYHDYCRSRFAVNQSARAGCGYPRDGWTYIPHTPATGYLARGLISAMPLQCRANPASSSYYFEGLLLLVFVVKTTRRLCTSNNNVHHEHEKRFTYKGIISNNVCVCWNIAILCPGVLSIFLGLTASSLTMTSIPLNVQLGDITQHLVSDHSTLFLLRPENKFCRQTKLIEIFVRSTGK